MTAAILRAGARTFLSVRKHRNYRLFFTGQVISNIGTWMQRVAQAWLVLSLTHSPVAVVPPVVNRCARNSSKKTVRSG